MAASNLVFVADMSPDQRVLVYRSSLSGLEDFAGMEVDGYALITDRFVLLCDTLLNPEDMERVTDRLQAEIAGRPLLVMNSHADWDHAWGNSYFTGERIAPLIGHEHCYKRLSSERERTFLTNYQKHYPEQFRSVSLTPPTITFADTFTLHGGDLTIELFSAPGHSRDHLAAWIPEIQLLLAFDAAEAPLPFLKSMAGVPQMFTTLEHFTNLQPRHVLCSHGKTTGREIIAANLAYLHELEQHGRQLLSRHLPTTAELEGAAELIQYPFEQALEGIAKNVTLPDPLDRTFYEMVHNINARHVVQWLMN